MARLAATPAHRGVEGILQHLRAADGGWQHLMAADALGERAWRRRLSRCWRVFSFPYNMSPPSPSVLRRRNTLLRLNLPYILNRALAPRLRIMAATIATLSGAGAPCWATPWRDFSNDGVFLCGRLITTPYVAWRHRSIRCRPFVAFSSACLSTT